MTNIDALIDSTKIQLIELVDEDIQLPEWRRRHEFKRKIEVVLNNLKIALVQGELEKETPTRNKYKIISLELDGDEGIELQEGDVPIGYNQMSRMLIALRPA
ncbi:MAG: hypothetical protein PHZ02_01195 [Desulfocapsaceae bacterium]|nr:hypothetical protein [Desulfocapsaceae bacterium]